MHEWLRMFDATSRPPWGEWRCIAESAVFENVWLGIAASHALPGRGHHSSCGQRRDSPRSPLHLVGGDWCECGVVALASANPDDLFQRLHEDFSVADFTGARGRED